MSGEAEDEQEGSVVENEAGSVAFEAAVTVEGDVTRPVLRSRPNMQEKRFKGNGKRRVAVVCPQVTTEAL